ncbi:MAG: DUF2063 domain-containing protein [Proteobacteria bacterium]|nr:DUF2063 domain-containing protein [Pseudomonadota bacterium]NOG59701.1 DUF2063 domain-containing protein [Pseudomonadota bacterium]
MTKASNNNKTDSFQDVQTVFTRHMRDPKNNPAPAGIEERRIKIYSDLVYNNIESFIANSFPVLRKIIPDEQWHKMLRDYVSNHQAHTPLFPKMPQEFLHYLQHERIKQSGDFPFIFELAHYEWIETSVAMDPREIDFTGINTTGDLLQGIPVLSQLAQPFVYHWPVHQISPDYLPTEKPEEATYIIVYRKINDDVGFMVLNTVSARLIEKIQNNTDKTGKELLGSIADELKHPQPDVVINGGLAIMQDMHEKNILLGILD